MKHIYRLCISSTIFLTLITYLSSCAMHAIRPEGRNVDSKERITIETIEDKYALWESDDMKIKYKLLDEKDRLTISGTLTIDYAILSSYPSAERLYIYLYQLNKNGEAVGKDDITPIYASGSVFPETIKFTSTLPKQKEAVSFAFAYWGFFEGSSRMAEDIEIFYSPFAPKEIE